jgi:hypothetical protein
MRRFTCIWKNGRDSSTSITTNSSQGVVQAVERQQPIRAAGQPVVG